MCYKMSRQAFEIGLAHLILFCNSNGNLNVPEDYICSDGYALGEFVGRIRCMYRKKQGATESDNPGTLTQNQIKRLDFIGFSFEKELEKCRKRLQAAKNFRSGIIGRMIMCCLVPGYGGRGGFMLYCQGDSRKSCHRLESKQAAQAAFYIINVKSRSVYVEAD